MVRKKNSWKPFDSNKQGNKVLSEASNIKKDSLQDNKTIGELEHSKPEETIQDLQVCAVKSDKQLDYDSSNRQFDDRSHSTKTLHRSERSEDDIRNNRERNNFKDHKKVCKSEEYENNTNTKADSCKWEESRDSFRYTESDKRLFSSRNEDYRNPHGTNKGSYSGQKVDHTSSHQHENTSNYRGRNKGSYGGHNVDQTSSHQHEDNRNYRVRTKGSYSGHKVDQISSHQHERSLRKNESYNYRNYNTESNTFYNDHNSYSDKLKRGAGRGREGNTSSRCTENNSSDTRNNYQHNSFRQGQSRGWQNGHDRRSREDANVKNEKEGWTNEGSQQLSEKNEKSINQSLENWDSQKTFHEPDTQDWNDSPPDESNWNIQDTSTSKPDARGTTSSYLDDSGISTMNPVHISPSSSTLNPDAVSFRLSDNDKMLGEICGFDKIEANINIQKEKYNSGGPNNMAALQPMKLEEQQDEARGLNTSKGGPDWADAKQRHQKRSRGKHSRLHSPDPIDNRRSSTEVYNEYSGVVSVGSAISVDRNSSQHSEFSLDETQSDRSSQQEEDRDYSYYKSQKNKSRWSDSSRHKHDSSVEERSPRYSTNSRSSMNNLFNYILVDGDDEWAEFKNYMQSQKARPFVKVTEDDKDLFTVGEDYSLAHCVAEDMNMGSGIAVEFRRKFKNVADLIQMRQKAGGLAVLEQECRFIYYMVTKKISSGKPTYASFWKSLKKLRDHMEENAVKRLAIPRIGCGLDRLDWNVVKPMVEFVFRALDVHILVCNFQQEESLNSPKVQRIKKCKIVHEKYQISEIDQGTIIVYFASADGQLSPIMSELDKKFTFLPSFKRSAKCVGDVIRFEDRVKNYLLYGCIVRQKAGDPFDFVQFGKCLEVIQKNNKKDPFIYVGFQRLEDDRDDILNEKVLNIMTHSLRDVDIYCCNSGTALDSSLNDSLRNG